MKTKNIWAVTFIHYLNNSLVIHLPEELGLETTLSFLPVLISILYLFVIYFPFLLTKEYRKEKLEDNEDKLVI
jgi:cellobiose-specific phosphotransferase system component IIC